VLILAVHLAIFCILKVYIRIKARFKNNVFIGAVLKRFGVSVNNIYQKGRAT